MCYMYKVCFHLLPLYPEEQARLNPAIYPPGYEMKMVAQEFYKLCEPSIKKLRGAYLATANLIFHSWLKDIKVHVEDWNLTERERPFNWSKTLQLKEPVMKWNFIWA